jgi:hypothetical protein
MDYHYRIDIVSSDSLNNAVGLACMRQVGVLAVWVVRVGGPESVRLL